MMEIPYELTRNIYIISRRTHHYYAQKLHKLGLTMGQFPFLMDIVEQDGITQEQLSQQLQISKSTTALIVRQLLDAQLLTREQDREDRRNFRLHATAAGQRLYPQVAAIIADCNRQLCRHLTAAKRRQLSTLLQGVRDQAEQW